MRQSSGSIRETKGVVSAWQHMQVYELSVRRLHAIQELNESSCDFSESLNDLM